MIIKYNLIRKENYTFEFKQNIYLYGDRCSLYCTGKTHLVRLCNK